MITRCAETGLVPPATGVIVRAAALPAGFLTVKIELMVVVVTQANFIEDEYVKPAVFDSRFFKVQVGIHMDFIGSILL